ncbi:MAG: hypothetical protein KGM17_02390 [Sphingomonadales bacterium]|nr:hypothetical protein [Sphingomonadales bacterium]
MALPLLAFALPLASMLAVAPVSTPAIGPADFTLAPRTDMVAPRRATAAELQALPHPVAPGYDGPWMFEGPALTAQPRRHGPVFEIAALGGGHEWAADLAHVAVDWQF